MSKINDCASIHRQNTLKILPEILYRWSPRSMAGEVVTEKELTELLEAARWAPSSFNGQPWHYYYASNQSPAFKDLFTILTSSNQEWCRQAGALMILTSAKISQHNKKPAVTHSFDTGASWHGLAIEATRRNYVIHAMGGFDREKAHQYLRLTDQTQVECMIAIGKPAKGIETEAISQRKSVAEISTKL